MPSFTLLVESRIQHHATIPILGLVVQPRLPAPWGGEAARVVAFPWTPAARGVTSCRDSAPRVCIPRMRQSHPRVLHRGRQCFAWEPCPFLATYVFPSLTKSGNRGSILVDPGNQVDWVRCQPLPPSSSFGPSAKSDLRPSSAAHRCKTSRRNAALGLGELSRFFSRPR